MNNLERLAREIRRVAALRATQKEVGIGDTAGRVMDMRLDAACKAVGDPDPTYAMIALRDLEMIDQ